MKPPFRAVFLWVLYVALFAAVHPVVRVIGQAIQDEPVVFPIITAVGAVALLVGFYFVALRRFWSWCDQPRKTTREVPPCS